MIRRLYNILAPRAYSAIMFIALFCTLAVKLFHSWRSSYLGEYLGWILLDISFLLTVEVILSLICFRWPKRWILRIATITAAVVCTWAVMNAGWLIRTGTQILPRVLLSLVRSPLHTLHIIGVNLLEMPVTAFILLGPSAVALTFFFFVLANPIPPNYNRKRFFTKVVISLVIVVSSILIRGAVSKRSSPQIAALGLHYNCHLRAIMSIIISDNRKLFLPERKIPDFEQLEITRKEHQLDRNVIVVVLEGVQYTYTSLADSGSNATPYLATIAKQGVEFSNTRSSLTHTTKALFALLTGWFSSASQDLAETVPAERHYPGIVTTLSEKAGYRTAFFQSALGSFESRPGLVYNLGFDKFWARDDLDDPNSFLGYLASDEFSMLKPITEWIKADERPFFLTVLCSVTHDPYEVPEWFDTPAKEPVERYQQSIFYTDNFLAALDVELARLGLTDETILCVVGDHGEAFGEHGPRGHALIAFDEALRIPFCVRAPLLVEPGKKVTELVSSIDLTPTLLGLLGFETEKVGFDGINVLGSVPDGRKVYFSGWMQEGPSGFVQGERKFIYNPADRTSCVYNVSRDPLELTRIELPEKEAKRISDEIISWRKSTIFQIDQQRSSKKELFNRWICKWTNRVSLSKITKQE
ncbi:MAG: LTA synthase family protein [Sedimentisphaerales bacterium]|nr:LTA synthase family protein [Sedimentisphaerales bacterium]